jgi:glutathione S-transferase
MPIELVIANKNYSSWSLRPWLLLRQLGVPFTEALVPLDRPDSKARMLAHSPAGRVPVLKEDGLVVWDSLAIIEYLHERFPDRGVWPAGARERAHARCLCAEMHAGFTALRQAMPMNLEADLRGLGMSDAVAADIERVVALWQECLERSGGPFLFGAFCAADAFYAPVTRRFLTYGVALPATAAAYVATIDRLPAMAEWVAAALREHDFVPGDEPYRSAPGS